VQTAAALEQQLWVDPARQPLVLMLQQPLLLLLLVQQLEHAERNQQQLVLRVEGLWLLLLLRLAGEWQTQCGQLLTAVVVSVALVRAQLLSGLVLVGPVWRELGALIPDHCLLLSLQPEAGWLRVAAAVLQQHRAVTVVLQFVGAHVLQLQLQA